MTQYGRIKYDLFFKRIFSKPHIVIAFLNTVLEQDLKSPIAEVSFEPTDFMISGNSYLLNESKHDVIDVFCIDQEGRRILIEIQRGLNRRAIPRFLDYQCRNYSSQFRPNDNYAQVVACYSVCWFFDLKPPHNALTETITLRSSEVQTDWDFEWKIKALYPINLDYEALKQRMLEKIEEWMLLDVVQDPDLAQSIKDKLKTPVVSEAFTDLDISGYTEEQLRLVEYEAFLSEYGDIVESEKQKAIEEKEAKLRKEQEEKEAKLRKEQEEKEAKLRKEQEEKEAKLRKEQEEKEAKLRKEQEQALKKNQKEASRNEKIAIAKKLLAQNLPIELISDTTGLSIEEIKNL